MENARRLRPSPALIVASIALVMAMSGAAVALPGKGKVKSNDIAKGAVKGKAIAKGAIGSKQIKGKSIKGNRIKDGGIKAKQIADGTITGAKVAPNGLDSSNIGDYKFAATGVVNATDGVDEATARAAAPQQVLFSKGPLSVYGKCYRDTTANETFAYVYAATTENGSLLDADDDLTGDPDFLNANTAEVDREIENSVDALANSAETTEGEFMAMAPDGTKIVGQLGSAVKNGDLAGGNGIYGAGNVCLFQVEVAG